MGKLTLVHDIHCDVDTFWKTFFDRSFNEALFREGLQFPQFEILEDRDGDDERVRRVRAQPKIDLPGPLKKLLGSGFAYTEETHFDKKAKVARWKTTPSTLADKMKNEGSVRVEPTGDASCRRIAELTVEAKIFGIGGLLESTTEKALRDGWEKSAHFMNKWLDEKR